MSDTASLFFLFFFSDQNQNVLRIEVKCKREEKVRVVSYHTNFF